MSELQTLQEIRDLMQRSSRFISLSGLSGVFAGFVALAGAGLVYWRAITTLPMDFYPSREFLEDNFIFFCFRTALVVLAVALSGAIYFTVRKSQHTGQSIWDPTARQLLLSLMVPVGTGGMFSLALLFHQVYGLIVPAMLIFYGLALLNAARHTLRDIEALGYSQIMLGIVATFVSAYGLLFWSIGFGLFHIVYGTIMYYKYERK
jgi:hypothetical protein